MSLVGAAKPAWLVGIISIWSGPTRFGIAVVARLINGIVFILASPDFRFPILVHVIGIVALVVVLVIVGPRRLDRFILWMLMRPHSFIRAWCLFGFAFGVLINYAGR